MKQSNSSIQTPEEAKIAGLRDCFAEIGDLKFAALLFVCTCVLLARSCNLGRASEHGCWSKEGSKRLSTYRRLSRFFATGIGDLLMLGVLRAVLRLALQSGSACCLAVDRTDWQSGGSWRNLLVIGLSFRGYLIPLVWTDLGHRGNSDAQARLELLDRLAAWWPMDEVPPKTFPLVGDREFGGEQWLVEVAKRGFAFVVRLKANRQMCVWLDGHIRPQKASLRLLRRYLQQKGLHSAEVVIADEYICRLVCLKNNGGRDKEPYLYLLTNLDDVADIGPYYQSRWTVECCFKHLKSNGFDLEGQGFQQTHKVEIIMAVLVLLYAVCVAQGIIQQAQQPKVATKKYRNGKVYRARSLFRLGLEHTLIAWKAIQFCFLNLVNELLRCLSKLYTFT